MSQKDEKVAAARMALAYVEDGMRLGIGTGSTAEAFVELLGEKVADGLKVVGVPTSERTADLARSLNIPLSNLDEMPELDLTIDGADEIDPHLNLIKGAGGALLREKIVATASERMIVIADGSKLVETLGKFPLSVEVAPFGSSVTARKLAEIARAFGCADRVERRTDQFGEPFLTDGDNFIYDCALDRITDPAGLTRALNEVPGVVDNGLFVDIATLAIVASGQETQVITRS